MSVIGAADFANAGCPKAWKEAWSAGVSEVIITPINSEVWGLTTAMTILCNSL